MSVAALLPLSKVAQRDRLECGIFCGAALKSYLQGGAADGGGGFFSIVFPVVGILFGGVHGFESRFPFPTHRAKMLWRVCAVYCTFFPLLVSATYFIGGAPHDKCHRWINCTLDVLRGLVQRLWDLLYCHADLGDDTMNSIFVALPFIPYLACRIILVVLTSTSLRAPPVGVYKPTSWTSFLPHFG